MLVHNAYGSLAERQAAVAARSAEEVAERARVAALIKKARTMPDPGVDRLVSKLEKNGIRVKDVGVPLLKPNGHRATDIDILLDNAAIQVKNLGGSKKISDQIRLNTEPYTRLPVIGFIVKRGRGADRIVRNAAKGGVLITNDPQLLIDVVRP